MEMKHNVVGWFEIPVSDMERAMKFYEEVMGYKLDRNQLGDQDMAWFPWVNEAMGAGGSLVKHESYVPNQNGVLVYLMAFSGDLNNELGRVEANGGKVIEEKRLIAPEHGHMGVFIDTEGNKIALHSKE